jgi:uncharacterized membrane protein YuzA (DUF378 family)
VVPTSYYDFFEACATVAGALIGLLFVAISVSPEKISGEHANAEHQVRAGAAFSALTNALIVALIALLPGQNLGVATISVGAVGLSSTIALAIVFYRNRQGKVRPGQFLLLAVPHFLYALEIVNGIALQGPSRHPGDLGNQGGLMIGFFVFAIARAWELVGATGTNLVATVAGMAYQATRREEPAAAPAQADDPDQE